MATSRPSAEGAGHIVLVGMMGAGKTEVARALAARLASPWVDTDRAVEQLAQMPVSAIFERKGETGFRELERAAITEELVRPSPTVIAVGGGAVTDEQTRKTLGRLPRVVWLRARTETLAGRVGNGADRPLLTGADVATVLARLSGERDPLYAEVADVIVDVDELTPDEVVSRIVEALA